VIYYDVCVFDKENIYKKCFCVLHTANTLTCFEFFLKKKYLKFKRKMCFSMDFLNTKIIFLHSGFYNMFVKLQRVLTTISKNTKILFFGEFIYYSPLMFG